MKKSPLFVLVFAILFLFTVQSAGTLVESIYILDLMNTRLDEKAAGILFFFAPALLLLFRRHVLVRLCSLQHQLENLLLLLLVLRHLHDEPAVLRHLEEGLQLHAADAALADRAYR